MHAPAGKMTRGRNEHRSMTLGDLAVLVAGVAVVLVLPSRQSYLPYPSDFLGPWPRWFPWCFCLRQALGAACIVVVPVVLWRRAATAGWRGQPSSSRYSLQCRFWPMGSRPV